MKTLLLSSFLGLMMATTALACPPCEPDEETPTVEEPEPPAVVHDLGGEGADLPKSAYYPCCIMNGGGIRPKWDLLRTPEQVLKMCQRAIEEGGANIYACGDDYIAPLK